MKTNLITIFTVSLFLSILLFGGALMIFSMMIIIPIALLRCMFDSGGNNKTNESI
jgi:hypothetical protein